MTLIGKKVRIMSDLLMKRRIGGRIWKYKQPLRNKREKDTLMTWVRDLPAVLTKKLESVRHVTSLDEISNQNSITINYMTLCRLRK